MTDFLGLVKKCLIEMEITKIFSHFFFDTIGAKKKLSKRNAVKEFRPLRRARRAPRPPPRRLLKKGKRASTFGRKLSLTSLCVELTLLKNIQGELFRGFP